MVVSKIFYFHPKNWQMIQFDEHIFQMGWFNHQLDIHIYIYIDFKLATSMVDLYGKLSGEYTRKDLDEVTDPANWKDHDRRIIQFI